MFISDIKNKFSPLIMILHDLFYVYNTIQTISLVNIDASYKERKLDLKNISELNIAETKRLLQFLMRVIKEYLCLHNNASKLGTSL